MARIQLSIGDDVYEALRLRARTAHKSMSALASEILREGLGVARRGDFSFIGSGASGRADISEHHDDFLAEDYI